MVSYIILGVGNGTNYSYYACAGNGTADFGISKYFFNGWICCIKMLLNVNRAIVFTRNIN